MRWPDGFRCPRCGVAGARAWHLSAREVRCSACRCETRVTSGTIFEGTRLPLVNRPCDQYELRPEPAAPKWRGGIGIIRPNRFLVDGTYSCEGDRQTDPPRAVFGGWDGLVASCRKNPDTAREEYLPAKVTGILFRAGEFIEFREPNAAGYGDPLERDPAQVREDVLDDFTTVDMARDAYGVVFADERTLEIDAAATEAKQAELRMGRDGRSLTDYFADRLVPSGAPVSVAGNREFGIEQA